MGVVVGTASRLGGPDLKSIRAQVIDAVKVIFDRAIAHDPDSPVIEDGKTRLNPPLPDSGPLQDCEFGATLLLVRSWIGDDIFTVGR